MLSDKELQQIKERIKQHYSIKIAEDGRISLNEKPIHSGPGIVYLAFGKEATDPKECAAISRKDLYRALNPDHVKDYFIDDRSEAYLNKCKENIGLLSISGGYDYGFEGKPDYQLEIWANATGSGFTDVKKVSENWIACTAFRTDIDDYCIDTFKFSKKPGKNEIRTANLINQIEVALSIKPKAATFTCWECGTDAHWLDTESTKLEEKWNDLQENYCGC
jgi:hypothetical protein